MLCFIISNYQHLIKLIDITAILLFLNAIKRNKQFIDSLNHIKLLNEQEFHNF